MRAALTALAAALALLVPAAASGGPTQHFRPRGVIPHVGLPLAATQALSKRAAPASPSFLTFDANYQGLINQYFSDVAAASGSTSNVYSIATQYSDTGYTGAGSIQYQSTFGGSYVDKDPLPVSGCNDGVDSVCLTDQQIQTEIQTVLTAKGWHGSTTTMYFLMTPNGVGSCFDGTSTQCTTNYYCAYHSGFFDSNSEPVIYANEPYNATIFGCSDGNSPNGDDADATINTISHEHNEAITDPFGGGWWNQSSGNENGDNCAWDFGSPLGSVGGQPYNQVINGHDYWLQQEYSNYGSACFQSAAQESGGPPSPTQDLAYHGGQVMHTNTTYAIYWLPTAGNTALPVVTGATAVNQTLTSSAGSWNGSPTGYHYQWQRCSTTGSGCVNISGATAATYTATVDDGGGTLRSTVSAMNVNGSSAYVASAVSAVVVPLPAAASPPVVSGTAAVGKTLSTTNGAWNTTASFAYQWLRCASDGTGCVSIPGGTAATYVATIADAGHTLEAAVSATNTVGTVAAVSTHTGAVVARPAVIAHPQISGKPRVGKSLTAARGTWSGPPTGYQYQWLRCSGGNAKCVAIRNATRARYRLRKSDAGHRLRIRIGATDAAGTTQVISRPTRVVAAKKRTRH
jgi:hypothetical protein